MNSVATPRSMSRILRASDPTTNITISSHHVNFKMMKVNEVPVLTSTNKSQWVNLFPAYLRHQAKQLDMILEGATHDDDATQGEALLAIYDRLLFAMGSPTLGPGSPDFPKALNLSKALHFCKGYFLLIINSQNPFGVGSGQ